MSGLRMSLGVLETIEYLVLGSLVSGMSGTWCAAVSGSSLGPGTGTFVSGTLHCTAVFGTYDCRGTVGFSMTEVRVSQDVRDFPGTESLLVTYRRLSAAPRCDCGNILSVVF